MMKHMDNNLTTKPAVEADGVFPQHLRTKDNGPEVVCYNEDDGESRKCSTMYVRSDATTNCSSENCGLQKFTK